MTTTTEPQRLPLAEAEWLASELLGWLSPACEQLVVAGSIRRRKATIGDIELVGVPATVDRTDLFGEPILDSRLDRILAGMIPQRLTWHPTRPANGDRLKRLWVPSHAITVELWLAQPDNLGNILAIRTGDAGFSHLLVTARAHGGLMPDGMRHDDGRLWREGQQVPCPTEAHLFAALNLPLVPPVQRTAETARRLAAEIRRAS